ncbi:MAG: hypothetical protein RLZZ437_1557, partial [Pseudomonadota bacterium]
ELPTLTLDLNALFGQAFEGATLPFDLSALAIESSLAFSLKATTALSGGVLTGLGIAATDFALDDLLTVGGELTFDPATLNLGLLELSVDGVETARLSLGIATDAGMSLTSDVSLDAGFAVSGTTTDGDLTATMQIDEAGDGSAAFVALDADTSYALLALSLSGTTDFVTGADDADSSDDEKAFTAVLAVSGQLNSSSANTAKERIAAFLNSANGTVDITISNTVVTDDALREGMEEALENLAVMSASEVIQFLIDIGTTAGSILTDAAFDVTVPFTDINFGAAATAISEVFAGLAESFLIDATQLGFSTGAPAALYGAEASFNLTGTALTDPQIDALKTIGVAEFRVATGREVNGAPEYIAVSIDLTDNAVMRASTDRPALLAEFVRLLDAAIRIHGIAASVVSGAISLNTRYPGNNPQNPVPTLSLVGIKERGVSATDRSDDVVNDNFSLTNLGFAAGQLDTIAGGLAANADDTLADGSDETAANFDQRAGAEVIIGPSFARATEAADSIIIYVTVNGATEAVTLTKPAVVSGGPENPWLEATGDPDIDTILASLTAGLTAAGVAATASVNYDSTGFVITPTTAGQSVSVAAEELAPLQSTISAALNEHIGRTLSAGEVTALQDYKTIELRIVGDEVDANGNAVVTPVTVDLETIPDLTNPAASETQILAAFADALNTALATYDIAVVVEDGAIKITSDFPGGDNTLPPKTFAIIGATLRSDDSFDDDFSLESLGIGAAALEAPDNYSLSTTAGDGADGDEYVLSFNSQLDQSLTFGPRFADEMVGVQELRFTVTVDGTTHEINIDRPDSGWVGAGNAPNYADLVDAFNEAFAAAGFALEVSALAGDAGLLFSVPDGTVETYRFGIEPEHLTRAVSLDALFDWVNVELNKVEVLQGSKLMLSDDGELLFKIPDITKTATIATNNQLSGLSLDQLGLGNLENVELSANLAASFSANFGMIAGIDLIGIGTSIASSTEPLSEAIGTALTENIFFQDVQFSAELSGKATNITGRADLGLVSIEIGASDPDATFIALNAQLDVGLVGETPDGEKTTQVSLANLRDVFAQDRMTDLIGRYDLQGGIVTTDGAAAKDEDGEDATGDTLRIVDADDYTLQTDEALVMFFAKLDDITIDVAGISGLTEGLIDSISIAVGNGLDPLNTTEILIDGATDEADAAIEGLSKLDEGDILDSFSAIGRALVVVGEKLKEDLPLLDTDIPLLNFSLLDGIDFATDFVDLLRDVRDNPQAALDQVEAFLEGIFGADTIELEWLPSEKTITFDMEFGFLRDYAEELPFSLDLDTLLAGDFGADIPSEVADLIGGIADVSGTGTLVFDPDLTMRFKFGIDLKPVLEPPSTIAPDTTELGQLASTPVVIMNSSGENDIELTWTDATDPAAPVKKTIGVDLEGLNTIAEIVEAINQAVVDGIGAPASDTVSFAYDVVTGIITFADSEGDKTDTTSVEALFGAANLDASGDPREILLDAGFTAFADAQKFTLVLGSDGEGWPVTVELAADTERDDAEKFADAINAALLQLSVSRAVLSEVAGPVLEVRVSQLVQAEVTGTGELRLVETNFAEAIGYEARDFAVAGVDVSKPITLTIASVGDSNIASVLGFDEAAAEGMQAAITSAVLYQAEEDKGAPRVYLDTSVSEVAAELTAGIADGLNISVGIGPLAVNVVGGTALLTAGAGSTDPARFGFTFVDADGDDYEDQYDLRDLFKVINDVDRSVLDLISLDIAVGLQIELPMSDSLGIFDPAEHGLTYAADLLVSKPDVSLRDVDLSDLSTVFTDTSDLINLFEGNAVTGVELSLPDLGELFSNFNYLAFLNDPRAVLSALDTILGQMQSLFDNYLSKIKLPIIGESIGAGVTFFDDFRFKVLEQIRVKAETPDPVTGELPTTIDLLTNEVNSLLNDLFNTANVTYLQAHLEAPENDPATPEDERRDAYLIASLNFSAVIFDEELAIDFDFGVPGLNLDVSEGSKIGLSLDYLVNIGFGIDRNGFFLLNDTDRNEVEISFDVNAGSFTGSAKVLGILGLTAEAVTLDANGNLVDTDVGVATLTATLGADLFGDQGLTVIETGTADETQILRDLSALDLEDASNAALDFDKLVYFNKINFNQLISFEFTAEFDVQIGLSGSVLDPTTGQPIKIGGVAVIPTVATEFWVKGSFEFGEGLTIDKLSFENVRLNMQELYEAVLKPVLDPIMAIVNPLADYFKWTQQTPFKEALAILGNAFPIIGIANTAIQLGLDVTAFVNRFTASGGMLVFGDFDFSGNADAIASGESSVSEVGSNVQLSKSTAFSGLQGEDEFGVFGNINQGIAIELPLLSDPSNILDLLLGKFDQVDLALVHFNLFNIDTGKINLVDELVNKVGAPGWVSDIIRRLLQAEISLKFKAGFSAGYDLGGIVNFVNTLDPVRLLDGVFIDSAPGSLVNADVWGRISLNAGIAGASAEVGAGVQISLNDPNSDGKLRIPEMIALAEAAFDAISDGDIPRALSIMFVGSAYYKAKLSVWAGIELPWPLPDIKWSTTVFDVGGSISFGGTPVPARIVTDLDAGETAFLNIGARTGDSMTKITTDGDDQLVLTGGSGGNYNATYTQGSQSFSGSFANNAAAIVIPAGEGNNTINMSAASGAIPTVTFTGSGNDTIILPTSGLHVVFAGNGSDTIQTNGTSTGTYLIFGEKGADTVNIQGGNVIYIGDDSFGARELFQQKFASGGLSETEIRNFFGIDANGIPQETATQKNFTIKDASSTDAVPEKVNLFGLLQDYTKNTQLTAGKDADVVTLGAGNHVVLTGSGNDTITINGAAGAGSMTVLTGAGNDTVEITNALAALVEAGAGSDRVFVNATTSTIWGFAAFAGTDGLLGTPEGVAADALAIRDGMDILSGGSGADKIYGQMGGDYIQGGDGNDTIEGGLGDDLLIGGTMSLSNNKAETLQLRDIIPNTALQNGLNIEIVNAADGADVINGAGGRDIMMGGGGNDSLSGSTGSDVLLGDFGRLEMSSNLVAQKVQTLFDGSSYNGTDNLDGGLGNDILIAGGGIAGETESVTDTLGSNIVLGDFGTAEGARMLEAVTRVATTASTNSSADSITTGDGNDLILGGEGDDVINAGTGADIVIGDLGVIDFTQNTISSVVSEQSGNDSITFATDDKVLDIVIGGGGADTITGDKGGLVFLGDDGELTLDGIALSTLLAYTPPAAGASAADLLADQATRDAIAKIAKQLASQSDTSSGDDQVTVASGALIGILGGGNDSATNGGAADRVFILGDDGTIEIKGIGNAAELTNTYQSTYQATDGADTITAGSGRDRIIGGGDADSITAGEGDNVVLGDSGSFDGVTLISALDAGDGADTVTAGAGADWVILGQGADLAQLGAGLNRVLGDSGRITATLASASEAADGGADRIETGADRDVIIAGAGADTVTADAGDNVVLGDAGTHDGTIESLESMMTSGDGNDIVTTGSGSDWVILGQGDDDANLGDGDNTAIGDSGIIVDAARLTLDTTAVLFGGRDSIRTGDGNDIIGGGAGADLILAGNGDNTVMGDNGNITYDPAVTVGVTSVTTVVSSGGAADTIETGAGRDVIVGGEAGDQITAGAGVDLVLGDQGVVTGSADGMFGTLVSLTDELPGDDLIRAGDGNDIVVAGLGNDSVYAGQGEDAVLGDSGRVVYSGLSAIEEITLEDQDRGGDDFITAAGVGGDNILVGQFGKDSVFGGSDDDVIVGDFALFSFRAAVDGFAGQSSADRVARIEAIRADLSFDDALVGDQGSDFMMGGMGDDTFFGDGGQDIIIGDTVILERSWTQEPGGAVFEETTLDTNFAFLDGGYDRMYGGTGPDVMIGGLGSDIFFGDTQFDLIYSDGYAGLFNANWESGFTGPTPQRFLIKSNFAGTGAIDVVSESQQDSSIGGPLDLQQRAVDMAEVTERPSAMDQLTYALDGTNVTEVTDFVIAILGSYDVVEAIAVLAASGADSEVLVAALRNEVMQRLIALGLEDLIGSEILIERLIALYLQQAGLAEPDSEIIAENDAGTSDDAPRLWNIAAE